MGPWGGRRVGSFASGALRRAAQYGFIRGDTAFRATADIGRRGRPADMAAVRAAPARSRSSFTFLPARTVGREHRPNSRSVHVHSAATRGSPHIAVPSLPHIPLPYAAHQSECGRTPPARGRHHEEEPSP